MIEVKVDRRWVRILYRLCGATSVHLEHEVCLAVTATCLTCASMLSLYRSSFGSTRDCIYIFITHLWLSRHFLHRLLCTTNIGTSLSRPRFLWTFRNVWICITCGGQYFDVPTVSWDVPSNWMMRRPSNVSCTAFSPTASSLLSSSSSSSSTLAHPALSSSGVPLTSNFEAFSRSAQNRRQTFRHKWEAVWRKYFVYIQPVVFTGLTIFSLWFLYKYMEAINSYSLAMRTPLGHDDFFEWAVVDPRTTPAASSKGQSVTMPGDDVLRVNADLSMKMFEAKYGNGIEAARRSREFVYSMFGMVSVIVIVGTVGSLWVYGRIMPPLPDLVAGCGGGMGKGGSHKVPKAQNPSSEQQSWVENYKSIVAEDRLVLHVKVMMLRLVEYMILCVMLPRSEYACRVTRHCEVEPMISEMRHPTLIGVRGESMYNTLVRDTFQGGLIYLTVFVCTFIILISQMIVLNRSHLALGSYTRQLPLMPKKSNATRKVGNKNEILNTLDSHGESGGYNPSLMGGIMNKISTFTDQIMKRVHDVLANELGALSTSRILAWCAGVHIAYTILIVIVWAYYAFTGKEWHSFVLLYLALFGSSVEIGYLDKGALSNISDEIKNHIQKEGKVL